VRGKKIKKNNCRRKIRKFIEFINVMGVGIHLCYKDPYLVYNGKTKKIKLIDKQPNNKIDDKFL